MFWWPGSVLGQALFVLGKVWVVLLPLAWLFWVEQGRVGWSPPRLGGFGTAVLLGLVLAAFILLAYGVVHRLGWIDPGQVADRARQTGLGRFGVYLGGAVYWITLNSLMEEYVWRWFCFRQCEVLFGGIGGVFAAAAGSSWPPSGRLPWEGEAWRGGGWLSPSSRIMAASSPRR